MYFKQVEKSKGIESAAYEPRLYHPELTASSAECRACRADVDLRRAITGQVAAIVDDPELSRTQMRQRLTELVVDYNRFFRTRGHSVLEEVES